MQQNVLGAEGAVSWLATEKPEMIRQNALGTEGAVSWRATEKLDNWEDRQCCGVAVFP